MMASWLVRTGAPDHSRITNCSRFTLRDAALAELLNDARVRTVGPTLKTEPTSVLIEDQLHGAGYALGRLPAQGSRASLSRRVCCESHPATGRQAIGSLELTCHVALVSEAGLGSSSGK